MRNGHLREGDLDVYRVVDADSTKTCLVAYVTTGGTAPSLICYNSQAGGKGGLVQSSLLKEGDLVVRKVVDHANKKECLISYVSTEGTSPYIYCSSAKAGQKSGTASKTSIPLAPAR